MCTSACYCCHVSCIGFSYRSARSARDPDSLWRLNYEHEVDRCGARCRCAILVSTLVVVCRWRSPGVRAHYPDHVLPGGSRTIQQQRSTSIVCTPNGCVLWCVNEPMRHHALRGCWRWRKCIRRRMLAMLWWRRRRSLWQQSRFHCWIAGSGARLLALALIESPDLNFSDPLERAGLFIETRSLPTHRS